MGGRSLLLLLALLAASGCGADFVFFETNHLSGAGTTTLIIAWADSPVDAAESVHVTLERVEVRGPGSDEVLFEGRQVHDLLTLVNGRSAEVARGDVPAGRWDGLRFVLSSDDLGSHTITVGGTVHVLSFARPGAYVVDVPYAMDLAADAVTHVHVDFNVRTSVRQAGEAWLLDPVLLAVDPTGAGAIAGEVRSTSGFAVSGATVSAQQSGWEVASTRTGSDGSFRLDPLVPGGYRVVVTAAGLAPGGVDAVQVPTGLESGGHVVLLSPVVDGTLEGLAPSGIQDLTVRIHGAAGLVAMVGVDPVSGAFDLSALAPGTYTVELWSPSGLQASQGDVLVGAGATAVVVF